MKLTIALITILLACLLGACSDQTPGDKERGKADSDSMSGIGNQ